MRNVLRITGAFLVAAAVFPPALRADGQASFPDGTDVITCSPAPCILPPTQASEGGYAVNTVSLAVDSLNPQYLALGANDFNCLQNAGFMAVYSSTDGGSTWQGPFCLPQIRRGNKIFIPDIDPVVSYDRNGVAYVAASYSYRYGSNYIGFVALLKSTDGINWSEPVEVLQVQRTSTSNSWLTVDTNAHSPFANALYVSAVLTGPSGDDSENQVMVSHSDDGGASWRQVTVAPIQHAPAGDVYTNMVVGQDGTVYLAWMYCNSGPFYFCSDHKGHMVFSKSSDGGNTWSTPTLLTTVTLGGLANSNVYLTNYPAIAVDASDGPNGGSLYVALNTWTGAYERIGVIRSIDGGKTWSKPVPVAPPSDNHDQFFPWISVSSAGLVGVSWLDCRNDPTDVSYQAFGAISTDGGKSFQPNVELTTAFSNPNNNGGDGWMGDYTGNAWAGPNNFVAAWMDSSNGVDMQVMVGGIRLK